MVSIKKYPRRDFNVISHNLMYSILDKVDDMLIELKKLNKKIPQKKLFEIECPNCGMDSETLCHLCGSTRKITVMKID